MRKEILISLGLATLTLAACSAGPDLIGTQFWQQIDISDAIYTQGPEAQKRLDRDLAQCVVGLRESEKQQMVKNAIPPDTIGTTANPDAQALADEDTPDHMGTLLMEHSDYHDLDNCMKAKGWERAKTVPYDVAHESRKNWYIANARYGYDPTIPQSQQKDQPSDYTGLNN